MRYLHEMTEEERTNALFRGHAVPVFELWVIAEARKHRGLEVVSVEYQQIFGETRTDASMVKKIDKMAGICSNTVMNVDDRVKDRIHNSLLKEKGGCAVGLSLLVP